VIRKKAAEPSEEARVQAILKLLADTDWKFLLAREWAQCIHHLLKIRLDTADNVIAVAIVVHLVDVVQHRVGLVAVIWAQFKE
jgi:hypothetical protein